MDVDALYARHRDALLVFLVRRTADTEVALDLWAETFAQAVAGRRRYRGTTDAEAAGWLFGDRPHASSRSTTAAAAPSSARCASSGLERPAADDALIAEIEERAELEQRPPRPRARRSRRCRSRCATPSSCGSSTSSPYADVARSLQISEPAARARVSRGLAALSDFVREATAT